MLGSTSLKTAGKRLLIEVAYETKKTRQIFETT